MQQVLSQTHNLYKDHICGSAALHNESAAVKRPDTTTDAPSRPEMVIVFAGFLCWGFVLGVLVGAWLF